MQKPKYLIKTNDDRTISILTYCKEHGYSYNVIYKIVKANIGDETEMSETDLVEFINETLYLRNVNDYNIRLESNALIGISVYTNGNRNKNYRKLYRHMSDHGLSEITLEAAEAIIADQTKKYTNKGLWVVDEEGFQIPLSTYFHTTSGISYTSLRDYMRLRDITHINELFITKDHSRQSVFLLGLKLGQLTSICDYMLKYQTTEIDYYFLISELSKPKTKKRQLVPIK